MNFKPGEIIEVGDTYGCWSKREFITIDPKTNLFICRHSKIPEVVVVWKYARATE